MKCPEECPVYNLLRLREECIEVIMELKMWLEDYTIRIVKNKEVSHILPIKLVVRTAQLLTRFRYIEDSDFLDFEAQLATLQISLREAIAEIQEIVKPRIGDRRE